MKKISLLLSICTLVFLAGCASKQHEETRPEEKQIQVAISAEGAADKLDATTYDSAMALYGTVYEPLVEYGGKGEFKPGLAKSWEISTDGKEYIFYLKENVKFSDGSEFNAKAVKFSLERAKKLNEMTTLQTLSNLSEVEVVDDLTVKLKFTQTSNQILNELCQTRPLRIMSPNAVKDHTVTGKFEKAIGTGAMMVKKYSAESTELIPNPYFNHEKPVDYGMIFKTIEDGSSRTLALRSGEIDLVGGTLGDITDEDWQSFSSDDKFKTQKFTGTMAHFLAFNPENEQLTTDIRRGIASAINSDQLSKQGLISIFRKNVQFVNSNNQLAQPYDPELIGNYLTKEGYQKNSDNYYEKDGKVLDFDLIIQTTEFPEWKKLAEVVENNLKVAGVKVNISTVDRESYYDILWDSKKYDLIFYRTYTDALQPYGFLNSLYANSADDPGVLADDDVLTSLLEEFSNLIEPNAEQEKFDQIFNRFSEETLAVPLAYQDEKFITSKKISKFAYSGLSDSPLNFYELQVE